MKKQKKLLLARNIFVFIIFVCLGIIVATEKTKSFLTTKFEKEIDKYIETNYKEIMDKTTKETTYKKGTYTTKMISKDNKNLYFIIKKDNKKITDTYEKDYLEGNSLFSYLKKELKKGIEEKTNTEVNIDIHSKLNQHTSSIQERIIKEDNLLELKFYTLEKQLVITDWSTSTIVETIIKTIDEYTSQNITPKNYTIIIINKNNLKETIKIENLTEDFKNNVSKEEIIDDIINDRNSKILKENDITYEYVSKEEK